MDLLIGGVYQIERAERRYNDGRRREPRLAALSRAFRRNRDGVTAIEFSLVAAPFLALVFGIFQTAFIFFNTQALEAAVSDASRIIMTGQAQTSVSSGSDFRDKFLCNPPAPRQRILPGYVDCSRLILDVRTAASFATTDMSASVTVDSARYCTGGPGAIVVVRAIYPMPVWFPVLSLNGWAASGVNESGQTRQDDGMKHMLMGVAAFRNEPFPNAPAAMAGC